ncbi:Phytocyanin domain-containing protein [Heracleum sosnowskyi]|uniref:Phytocyanin domain-containing protein n=1 Tax=Heracleum sosnowskyi TaxID=360622 RepID=A0AAD8JJR9_9APIA|nr:Phytocyanin domain-containing protein [Heracleum sosnowskyi]
MAISKLVFFLAIALLFSCVFSYQFEVGGDEGWIEPSSANFTSDIDDPYNVWAAQNRFRIGDTIHFRYENDSVLVVGNEDYENCTTTNAISEFNDGDTVFEFKRSGFFYFISGQPDHCTAGQKMIIDVVHPSESTRAHQQPHPPESAPAPGVHALGPSSNFHSSTTRITAVATFVVTALASPLFIHLGTM